MIKRCVICGAEFPAPPSSKKITCSKACSSIRKAESHTDRHNVWSDDARSRYRQNQAHVLQARRQVVSATKAAMDLPESQRGPQHRECKVWILKDPVGSLHRAVGLTPWARDNYKLFEPDSSDPEATARRIRAGFSAIASRSKTEKPVTSYKSWALVSVSEKTLDEQAIALVGYNSKNTMP